MPPTAPKDTGNTRKLIMIIAGIGVLLAVAVGAALATRVWDPLWNPFRPDPETVLDRMVEAMEDVTAAQTVFNVGVSHEQGVFTVQVTAQDDTSDPENPKGVGSFSMQLASDIPGESFSIVGDIRELGTTSYMRVTDVDLPAEAAFTLALMFGIDINEIQGQWLQLDAATLLGIQEKVDEETLLQRQQEYAEKINQLFSENQIYYVKDELSDDIIAGAKVYHYELVLDNDELRKVLPELFKLTLALSAPPEPKEEFATDLMAGMMAGALSELLDEMGEITGEMWIGKKDYRLYQATAEKTFTVFDEDTLTIDFSLSFSRFNEPVTVEAPADAIPFEDLVPPELLTPSPLPFPGAGPGFDPLSDMPPSPFSGASLLQSSLLKAFR